MKIKNYSSKSLKVNHLLHNKYFKYILFSVFGILFILLLVSTIIAYILGNQVRVQLDKQFHYISSCAFIDSINRTYYRGLFTSREIINIQINKDSLMHFSDIVPNNEVISYETIIEHNILNTIMQSIEKGRLTLAYTTTKINFYGRIEKILNHLFNQQEPIIVNNVIYFNQNGEYHISSPAFDYAEEISKISVKSHGISSSVQYNANFDQFHSSFSLPFASLHLPSTGSFFINDLRYASNIYYDDQSKLNFGTNNVSLKKIGFQLEKDNALFNDYISKSIKIFTVDVSYPIILNLFGIANAQSFQLNNFKFATESTKDNQYINYTIQSSFDQLTKNNDSTANINNMELKLAFSRILAKEFGAILQQIQTLTKEGKLDLLTQHKNTHAANRLEVDKHHVDQLIKPNQADHHIYPSNHDHVYKEFIKHFADILLKQPNIQLDKLQLTTQFGDISINGNLHIENFAGIEDLDSMDKLMQKVYCNMQISIPKKVILNVLANQFVMMLQYNKVNRSQAGNNLDNAIDNQANNYNNKTSNHRNNKINNDINNSMKNHMNNPSSQHSNKPDSNYIQNYKNIDQYTTSNDRKKIQPKDHADNFGANYIDGYNQPHDLIDMIVGANINNQQMGDSGNLTNSNKNKQQDQQKNHSQDSVDKQKNLAVIIELVNFLLNKKIEELVKNKSIIMDKNEIISTNIIIEDGKFRLYS